MPKARRVGSFPFENTRVSPYPYSSRDTKQCKHENLSGSVEDVKEWEEARCPICLEPPHNVVLLNCSSYEKGCRPYICNTSYRHSNCLDQFCKSSVSSPSTATLQDIAPVRLTTSSHGRRERSSLTVRHGDNESSFETKLLCPLCRGNVYGWSVVEPARNYMNSKTRSCSSDSCGFSGTYSELRKHARADHPLVRPTEVDPERQDEWTRLERERDYEDMLSSIQSIVEENPEDNVSFDTSFPDYRSWLSAHLTYLAVLLDFFGSSRSNEAVQNRRPRNPMRFRYDQQENVPHRRQNFFLSERMPFGNTNYPQSQRAYQGRRPNAIHGARMARGRGLRWRTVNNAR